MGRHGLGVKRKFARWTVGGFDLRCSTGCLVACGAFLPAAARPACVWGIVASGRADGGLALRSRASESSPGRLGFRGLRSFGDSARSPYWPRSMGFVDDRGRPPATPRFAAIQAPVHPAAGEMVGGGGSGSRPIEGLDRPAPAARCGCDVHMQAARTLRVREAEAEAEARSAKRFSRAETSSAECRRRAGCRAPRRGETRNSSPTKEVAAAGWAGARLAANRDVAGGRPRSANHAH